MRGLDTEKMMDQSLAEQYGGMTNFYLITAGAILISTGALITLKTTLNRENPDDKSFVSIGLEREVVVSDESELTE